MSDRYDEMASAVVVTMTAREAELDSQPFIDRVAAAIRIAVATEREACARLCDDAAAGSRGIHRFITDARVAAEVTGKIHRAETLAKRIRARAT